MKYICMFFLSAMCCGCSTQLRELAPNHLGITPSCEWEIQKDHDVKHKPKIQTTMDWNF